MKTIFLRALEADDKATALRAAIDAPRVGTARFEMATESFSAVPGSPFSYWVSDEVRGCFTKFPAFENERRFARQGGVNGDDFRWLRLWFEAGAAQKRGKFFPIAKGGKFSPFYADLLLQGWWDPRRNTFWAFTGLPHRPSLKPASFEFYFRAGLTWPRRTDGLSLRVMPLGCLFADKGPAAFVDGDDVDELLALAAITNSQAFSLLVSMQLARTELAQSFEVGLIQNTPVPVLNSDERSQLASLAKRSWSLTRAVDARAETSHAFIVPALLQVSGSDLDARARAYADRLGDIEVELKSNQAQIDAICFRIYEIDKADRGAVKTGIVARAEVAGDAVDGDVDEDALDADSEADAGTGTSALIIELMSWAMGVALGRFDLRLATGVRPLPIEPEPFDPLPTGSPGMLVREDGLPCERAPQGYPINPAFGEILVDDAGHPRDLTAALQAVFRQVFATEAEARWEEAVQFLTLNGQGFQRWLAVDFFDCHLKRYSKSRRRAPIYWQLSVPSGQYSVWLYAHQVTRNTLFDLQKDVVAPKLAHEENRLADLRAEAVTDLSAAKRRKVEAQERHVEELRVILEEVRRVAPLWSPFLDDGVALAMAPLWRLVPQHRAWQRELKSRWDDLIDEKYEWARMAMHLWPERVVPKCTTDRSLAIAHELEDAFWVEGLDRRWRQRGSIDSTIRYLEEGLLSESLRATVMDLQRFARQHIATQSEAGWWMDLKSGRHDDTPLALALWPERVLQRARTQPSLLSGLGLPLPARGFDDRALAALLRRYRPRHSEVDLEVLEAFCATFGNAAAWETRWADFDIGRLDEQPLARFLYPRRVLARALTDHAFAAGHDLARWFWLNAPAGPRRLKEPEEEVRIALAERDRPAMKAALKAFLEAPVAPGSARRERRARSA
ncbi:hypothetical protein [Roseococcus pinisoli]|uniref:Uncharacterized protein n=1 Tax=Roseococcus pinisoli TaxID=2835040 RepID=A0ABS5QCU6_9PROT|nr:hypothetical protein [Roseococcus pinisoli]MBS7811516.1 hypothetical protein [Roseococcus pinisoli]